MKPSVIFAIVALAASSLSQVPAEPQFEGSLGPLSYSGGYILSWNSPEYTRIIYLDATNPYSCTRKAESLEEEPYEEQIN